MKIRPVGADYFHTNRRTDRHDKVKSLLAIVRRRLKLKIVARMGEVQNFTSQNKNVSHPAEKEVARK
jgi:hypothetical protein